MNKETPKDNRAVVVLPPRPKKWLGEHPCLAAYAMGGGDAGARVGYATCLKQATKHRSLAAARRAAAAWNSPEAWDKGEAHYNYRADYTKARALRLADAPWWASDTPDNAAGEKMAR